MIDDLQQAAHTGCCSGSKALHRLLVAHHQQFHRVETDRDNPDFLFEGRLTRCNQTALLIQKMIEERTNRLRSDLDFGDFDPHRYAVRFPFMDALHPAFYGSAIFLRVIPFERLQRHSNGQGERSVKFSVPLHIAGDCSLEECLHLA